jgi:hypothetical protein
VTGLEALFDFNHFDGSTAVVLQVADRLVTGGESTFDESSYSPVHTSGDVPQTDRASLTQAAERQPAAAKAR